MNFKQDKKYYTKEELGVNILEGIQPEIKRLDGVDKEVPVTFWSPVANPEFIKLLADLKFDCNLDIECAHFSLLYDLKEPTKIEQFYVASYKGGDTISGFELYASNDKNNLFNPENCIISCDNRNNTEFAEGETYYAGALYNVQDVCCQYIGFVNTGTNSPDGKTRLATLGVYNSEYTAPRNYINKNYCENVIAGIIPEIKGEYKGDSAYLTDGAAFQDDRCFVADNTELKFTLPRERKVDKLVIIAKNLGDVYYADDNSGLKKVEYTKTTCEVGEEYLVDVSEFGITKTATLKLSGNIDEILMICRSIDLKVDFNDVITKDFLGVGGNYLPTHLFEMSRMQGFNDAHMQLERRRLATAKPSVVRLWFQLDWFVLDEEDYYNRKYTFKTPKMQAVFKDLDALRDAGIEVEISYAWHTNYPAHDWYSFPEAFTRKSGAPHDVKQCAISCVDLLKELIINRGYTNIKYLSFCNESNQGVLGGSDFLCPEGIHPMDHWLELLRHAHKALKDEGMDKYVDIWAAEIVGDTEHWADFFNKNAPEMYTLYTSHHYHFNYTRAIDKAENIRKVAGDRSIGITEYATYDPPTATENGYFICNNIANTLGFINGGASILLFWILSGSLVDEWYLLNTEKGTLWRMPTYEDLEPTASEYYYHMSLFTNYIKRHSTVYKVEALDEGVHPTVIVAPDGNITVFAEVKTTEYEKALNVDFGKSIGKKFYKHIVTRNMEREANLIVPPAVAEIEVQDKLSDIVPAEYCMVVYTTIPPVKQVVMDKVFVTVDHEEEIKLNASVIDGDGTEGEFKWSIADYNHVFGLPAEISEDGVFKTYGYYSPRRWWRGHPQFAVKAELPTGEYGITIVTVKKDGQ